MMHDHMHSTEACLITQHRNLVTSKDEFKIALCCRFSSETHPNWLIYTIQ